MNRPLVLALIAAIAAVLEIKLGTVFGWAPDFLLMTLVTLSFFATFPEFIFLVALGGWLITWQPLAGWEMLWYMAVAVAAFWLRPLLPWRLWLNALILGAAGIIVFYLGAAGYSALAAQAGVFWQDVFWSLIAGALTFFFLEKILLYEPRGGVKF